MDNKKIVIYIAVLVIISSCGNVENPKERNIISFKNNVDSVGLEIQKLNKILERKGKKHFVYGIDESNVLFIEDSSNKIKDVGLLTDKNLQKESILSFIVGTQRNEFIQLIRYLKQNYITRCNHEKGHYIYLYRDDIFMADRQKNLQRFIVFAKDKAEIENLLEDDFVNAAHGGKYNLAYKILEQNDNLFLLANKDAEIWEN
jgi:hypothetical protein